MTLVILFVLGAIFGSFLNVVGLRWGTDKVMSGRSRCPDCKRVLNWWELIPIASFIFLKRKCANCGLPISWQYLLIEIWTGLVFLSIYNLQFTILQKLIILCVFCIYIVITIYDLKHKIIPDSLVYSAILLSVVGRYLSISSILDWLSGPIIFIFFGAIWLFSRGKAMGFGDAKLGLSVGLLLGAAQGFSAIVLAFWLGAGVSLAYIFLSKLGFLKSSKELTMKSEIPFAPFIIWGAWLAIVFNLNILNAATF